MHKFINSLADCPADALMALAEARVASTRITECGRAIKVLEAVLREAFLDREEALGEARSAITEDGWSGWDDDFLVSQGI